MRHSRSSNALPFFTPLSKCPEVVGMSRSTLLRREKDDPTFPKRRRLGPGRAATAFVTNELLIWAEKREKVGE